MRRAPCDAPLRRRGQQLHLMNGVARSFDAGLSLAALGRLGGAVEGSPPRGPLARSRAPRRSLPGGTAHQKVLAKAPVAALQALAPPVGRRSHTSRRNNLRHLARAIGKRRCRAATARATGGLDRGRRKWVGGAGGGRRKLGAMVPSPAPPRGAASGAIQECPLCVPPLRSPLCVPLPGDPSVTSNSGLTLTRAPRNAACKNFA